MKRQIATTLAGILLATITVAPVGAAPTDIDYVFRSARNTRTGLALTWLEGTTNGKFCTVKAVVEFRDGTLSTRKIVSDPHWFETEWRGMTELVSIKATDCA